MPKSWPPISDRWQRMIARRVFGKTLPTFVCRWDGRSPDEIRRTGFQPRGAGYADDHAALMQVSLFDHVRNNWTDASLKGSGGPGGRVLPADVTQRVSTGSYRMLDPPDAIFIQHAATRNFYKIRTSDAQADPGQVELNDVNKEFDDAKRERPYRTQREWIKLGGIAPEAVVGYMPGTAFKQSVIDDRLPHDEEKLAGRLPLWAIARPARDLRSSSPRVHHGAGRDTKAHYTCNALVRA